MERQEKKGSKKAAALALGLALALTVGMTSAYLADSSELITNEFDPEWVFTDVEESGDQQYDIVPGTEETKDPKVKVNNSVDAYVYLIVTDKINANGQVVDYTIDPMWTEISNLPETIYDGEGNPITLTEYDKVYYTVAPKTADGETSEVRDDFELIYPVLVGDKVSYPSSLTNSDLEGIEDPDNILSFKSYAIQKDPFESELDALQPWEAAKEEARAALLEKLNSYDKEVADYDHGNAAQNQAYADAIAAIDNATTLDAIEEAKNDGIEAIDAAATKIKVGDKVKLGASDKTFYVTKVNGTQIEVLDQDSTKMPFDDNGDKIKFENGNEYLAYSGSTVDNYLEVTYYTALPADVKEKIVVQNIKQSAYDFLTTHSEKITEITVGERHVYLLDMDDIVNLKKTTRAAMFPDGDQWTRTALSNNLEYTRAWAVQGGDGIIGYSAYSVRSNVCAAFTIDLNGLDYEIL